MRQLLAFSLLIALGGRVGGFDNSSDAETYVLRLLGQDVGTARYEANFDADSLRTRSLVSFRLRQGDQVTELELRGELVSETASFLPRRYHLVMQANGEEQATIRVAMRADSAVASVRAAGLGEHTLRIPLERNTFLLDNNFCLDHYQLLLWHFHRSGCDSSRYPFLVPQILLRTPQVFHLTLRKGGMDTLSLSGEPKVSCRKIEATSDAGPSMQFWVRETDGLLLRWTVPAQFAEALHDTSQRSRESLRELDLHRVLQRLIDRLYIRTYADLGDWRRLEYLRLQAKLDILAFGEPTRDTPWQGFQGECRFSEGRATYDGIFTIRMLTAPPAGRWPRPEEQRELGRWLKAEPMTPIDQEEIVSLADSLRRSCTSALEALRSVCGWIHANIRYEITGSDALTCLRTRRGDCGPQSYLAIALLRAMGIPARIAGGLLYVGGRFGQHNWIEAWLSPETGWIPADPTTGEVDTFSAAHITLWQGWAGALHPEAGDARLEVLEFRKASGRE
jgi:hypothetical protein